MRLLEKAGFQTRRTFALLLAYQWRLAGSLPLRPDCRRPAGRAETGLSSLKFPLRSGTGLALALAVIVDAVCRDRCVRHRADQDLARRRGARPVRRRRDLSRPGRELPGVDRAGTRRHRAAHRGRGHRPELERRLGGVRARQQQRPAARPADRRAAFPAGQFRAVLARSRLQAHRRDHPQRRFRARPAAERRRRRLPRHAQPRLGRHLRRRAGVARRCRRSICGSPTPTRTRSTPTRCSAAS